MGNIVIGGGGGGRGGFTFPERQGKIYIFALLFGSLTKQSDMPFQTAQKVYLSVQATYLLLSLSSVCIHRKRQTFFWSDNLALSR